MSVHKVGTSIEPHTITLTVEDSNSDIETAQIDLTMLFKGDFEPKVFNTGVDANGDALGDRVLDSHWTLTTSPDPTYNGPETYTVKSGYALARTAPLSMQAPMYISCSSI